MSPRRAFWVLLLLSAVLRFGMPSTPPGLHIDEASNAWNARCLGQTMFDEHKQFLPWLYTRAFNDNRSPLYLYLAVPFEMAMGPLAVRVPAMLSGIAATLLLWQLVRKLAGERVGFVAALVWALDPTFVQFTRWGHEASITPMLVLAALCLWQRAGLLWTDGSAPARSGGRRPLRWAIAAGLFTAFACYGYAAIRLYLPVLMLGSFVFGRTQRNATDAATRVADFSEPQAALANPESATPVAASVSPSRSRRWMAAAIVFAIAFAPLVYAHLTDPAINERGRQTWTWDPGDAPLTVAGKLAARYAEHFDPRFLFISGTANDLLATLAPPPPFGALPWLWGPLILLGLFAAVRQFRTDRLSKLAVVAIVVYPAGDVLNALGPPNALRLLCGWWCFALLIMVGIEWAVGVVKRRSGERARRLNGGAAIRIACVVFAVAVALPNVVVLLVRWGTEPAQEWQRGVDFKEACAVIKPMLRKYDAVCFTTRDTPYNYAQVLCYLDYSTEQFLTKPKIRARVTDTKRNEPDLLVATENLFFLHDVPELPAILGGVMEAGTKGKTLWILRPADAWPSPQDRLLHTVYLSDGTPSLVIVEHERRADAPVK